MTNANWTFPVAMAYSGKVPATVDSEILRLRLLFRERCRGPYDETAVKFGLAVFVQGVDEIKPMKRRGIRIEPFKNNLIIASIYIHRVDWDVSPAAFQRFLWRSAEEATWECIERLKKHGIAIVEDRFRHDLSLVRREFLGNNDESSSRVEESLATNTAISSDAAGGGDEHQVIVQYRISFSSSADDVNKMQAVEHLLGKFLESAGLGYCDGGDIGSGTMNIFCLVKPQCNATPGIIETLRKNDLLNGAVIAESANGDENVIWPPDFKGEFQILGRR